VLSSVVIRTRDRLDRGTFRELNRLSLDVPPRRPRCISGRFDRWPLDAAISLMAARQLRAHRVASRDALGHVSIAAKRIQERPTRARSLVRVKKGHSIDAGSAAVFPFALGRLILCLFVSLDEAGFFFDRRRVAQRALRDSRVSRAGLLRIHRGYDKSRSRRRIYLSDPIAWLEDPVLLLRWEYNVISERPGLPGLLANPRGIIKHGSERLYARNTFTAVSLVPSVRLKEKEDSALLRVSVRENTRATFPFGPRNLEIRTCLSP